MEESKNYTLDAVQEQILFIQDILHTCLLCGRHAARDPVDDTESCEDWGASGQIVGCLYLRSQTGEKSRWCQPRSEWLKGR